MKFSIETVSKMTGIPAPSLRNWEKRYGFPTPERTSGGHRFYSAIDVEFLKKAVQWIEEGQSLNEIAKVYKHETHEDSPALAISQSSAVDDVSYRVQLIYEALLNFDQMATLQHYATLSAKLSVEQLFDRVFEVILKRAVSEFAEGVISGAQERFAISFAKLKLSTFLSLDFPPTREPKILAANLSGETSEGDLMLIAAHLKFRGFPVFYFGTDLPFDELKSVIREIKPDALCLSYESVQGLLRDARNLQSLKIPTCLSGSAALTPEAKNQVQRPVFLCQKSSSSEVAQYVEMICESKTNLK